MLVEEYQNRALATAVYGENMKIVYPTLGLAGESGEVAEKIKKVFRDCNGEITEEKAKEIAKEIGDVLWYCNALTRDIGYTLEMVMDMNLQKLESRKARGVIHGNGDNR